MQRRPSVATRHESEETTSLSSLPVSVEFPPKLINVQRRAEAAEVAEMATEAPERKTEVEGREARAPLQRTGAIGAINTDIGK